MVISHLTEEIADHHIGGLELFQLPGDDLSFVYGEAAEWLKKIAEVVNGGAVG